MEQYLTQNWWIILLLSLWVLPWKGVALWKSSHNNHKWWFIAMLIINSLAILEIIYIFFFSEKKTGVSEIK
ncbi:hypothetical protein KJ763_02670 [Patescibacteria group bacterium]|nr:hypothetical protein [Patescibacteria group bacterium]